MKRSFSVRFSKKTQSAWWFQALLLILGMSSAGLLWYFDGQTLGLSSLQTLWQSALVPQNAWQWLLSWVADDVGLAVFWMAVQSSLTLCAFAALALHLGLSYKTTFALFLLMNFNPEFNDVRLSMDSFQLVLFLWLMAVLAWLKCGQRLGLWLWGGFMWLATCFEPATTLLALVGVWYLVYWEGQTNRMQSALLYGMVMSLALLLLPQNQDFILAFGQDVWAWQHGASERLLQLGDRAMMSLSALESYGLALALVVQQTLACAGLLVVGILVFGVRSGVRRQTPSVLLLKAERFLWLGLVLWGLMLTLLLVYQGRTLGDLAYMPLVMVILLLRANVVFYILQRLRALADIQQLVLFWLVVTFGLASMMSFGPSASYLREAGQWGQSALLPVMSNNRQVLFYAGRSPLVGGADYVADFAPQSALPSTEPHIMLYQHHRKALLPATWAPYQVVASFQNRHGDRVYALRYSPK